MELTFLALMSFSESKMLLRYYWFFFILYYFRIEAFLYTYFVRKKLINICDI